MDWNDILDQAIEHAGPADAAPPGWWTLLALAVACVVVALPLTWRLLRPAVTIVHELGHGIVGMACGRRFTGFVVSGDMSGHAVTVGPSRGLGRVLSAWAGYPAPALVGALLVQVAFGGWARPVVTAILVILALSLVLVRSAHTLGAVLLALAATGALWWLAGPSVLAAAVLAVGVLLLLGAWRHLGAVIGHGRAQDDPQQLARLTGVPAWAWTLSYALVIGACTWWAWRAISPHMA